MKWIKILGMRYEFHCYVTFEGLELRITWFWLWHLNLFAIFFDINRSIKLIIISNEEKAF